MTISEQSDEMRAKAADRTEDIVVGSLPHQDHADEAAREFIPDLSPTRKSFRDSGLGDEVLLEIDDVAAGRSKPESVNKERDMHCEKP